VSWEKLFDGLPIMVELKRPNVGLVASYLDFVAEMHQLGEEIHEGLILKAGESKEQFVDRILCTETSPGPGLVPATVYWGAISEMVVGRIALRHYLDDTLKEFGGHIGYEVRPSYRRRGVAKEMLRLLLETPKAKQIGRLLLTCAPDNEASNKTIQANGGVLAKTAFVEKRQRETNYYWIQL
jgi:predicted acetyltransferase